MLWFAQGSASLFLMVAELRAQERQAAEELGQWKTRAEERRVIDASQAAITLAMLMAAELEEVEKRAGVGEIAGRRRPDGPDVASPQPAALHGEPARVFPANASAPERRPRLAGVIGWSGIRSAAKDRFRRRQRPSRSAAAMHASQPSKSAGTSRAPAWT